MRKTRMQAILNKLQNNYVVEVPSTNLRADHSGFDKILRMLGLKKNIDIAEDRTKSTIIFRKKS